MKKATVKHFVSQSVFTDIYLSESDDNNGSNTDSYTFKIVCEGQPVVFGDDTINGKQFEEFVFTLVGNFEFEEFLTGMHALAEHYGCSSNVKA